MNTPELHQKSHTISEADEVEKTNSSTNNNDEAPEGFIAKSKKSASSEENEVVNDALKMLNKHDKPFVEGISKIHEEQGAVIEYNNNSVAGQKKDNSSDKEMSIAEVHQELQNVKKIRVSKPHQNLS